MARNLDLAARTENIREQRPAPTQFDLDQIKAHFDESISAVEKQYEISDELFSEGKLDEAKTILRSQIVLAEGVLDFLIHEISKYGLYHMYEGSWEKSERYPNFSIQMRQFEIAMSAPDSKEWFFEFSNDRFSRDVFLAEDNMKDQLNLVGVSFSDVMQEAFPMDNQEQSIKYGKEVIKALFARRNAIAHQNDRSHASAEQADITKSFVQDRLAEVKAIGNAIYVVARRH